MKDQLIAILEAMRLSQAALGKDSERGGATAETTVKELRRFLLEPHVVSAMEALYPSVHSPNIAPTDSPHEVTWRENYQDLAGAVGMIHEATEEAFGPLSPLPNSGRTVSSVEDCEHIAQAIAVYAEKMGRRIAELEGQLALTSRVSIEGVTETEDAPPITSG